MLDDPRLEAASAAANAALGLARDHGVPPTAAVFEVLLAHLQGGNTALTAEVISALALPDGEREARFEEIRTDHLGANAVRAGLERVRSGLSSEISEVSDRLSVGVKGNLRLAEELREGLRDMAGSVTREEVQAVCRHLAVSGRTHLSDTQAVAERLRKAQFQLGEMQKELDELREAASKDHLTGLPNRRYLEARLVALLASPGEFCVAMLDLDHFKQVNDRWGHAVGDTILRGIGQILHHNTKGKDFAARIGGEEFAVVLPDTPLAGAAALCETIRTAFADVLWVCRETEEEIGRFTLSAGVASRAPDDTSRSLFERADRYLYDAKKGGRNRVVAGG